MCRKSPTPIAKEIRVPVLLLIISTKIYSRPNIKAHSMYHVMELTFIDSLLGLYGALFKLWLSGSTLDIETLHPFSFIDWEALKHGYIY